MTQLGNNDSALRQEHGRTSAEVCIEDRSLRYFLLFDWFTCYAVTASPKAFPLKKRTPPAIQLCRQLQMGPSPLAGAVSFYE